MKKILFLLVCFSLALFLTACGGQSAQEAAPVVQEETETVEEPVQEEPAEEEPAEEPAEEEPAEEPQETNEEKGAAYALYDKFIEDLKAGGIVDAVDDSGAEVDGMWIFYVNDGWNALPTSQKQALADSILSEIVPWADGMFGMSAPMIVIEDFNGNVVAQSNFSSTAMNVK